MTRQLRFRDLKARGIADSRPMLKRMQEKHGFPAGKMITPNIRAWSEDEVDDWLASRPVENTRRQGVATPEGRAKSMATKARRKIERADVKAKDESEAASA